MLTLASAHASVKAKKKKRIRKKKTRVEKVVNAFHFVVNNTDAVLGQGEAILTPDDRFMLDKEFKLLIPRFLGIVLHMGLNLEPMFKETVRQHRKEIEDIKKQQDSRMSEGPDRETLGRLLTAWQSVFGKTPAMVRDAVKQASVFGDEYVELRDVLGDIAGQRGEINRRKLGWWIKQHAGRIVDGRRFVRASGNRSAEAWQVDVMESVSITSNKKSVGTTTKQGKVDTSAGHREQLPLFG